MGRRSQPTQSAAASFAPVPPILVDFDFGFVAADFIPPTVLRWTAWLRSALDLGLEIVVAFVGPENEHGAGENGVGDAIVIAAQPNALIGGNPAANAPNGAILAVDAGAAVASPLMGSLRGILGEAA